MRKVLLAVLIVLMCCSCSNKKELPLPEVEDGVRGDLGVDKNINEATIDEYLNRGDAVYRDLRMLIDDADYEAIGGHSILTGFIKGFEVVPLPFLCHPEGLPEEVGKGYTGPALFTKVGDEYIANYEESLKIIEGLFPRNKIIFLMCGGGGYAGMGKKLLIGLGYDPDKIYDVGGYWYYEGKNKVDIEKQKDGHTYYAFDKVNYHEIDFHNLTPINGYDPNKEVDEDTQDTTLDIVNIKSIEELNKLISNKETFLLYIYLPGCTSCASFKPIVKDFIDANKDIKIYQLNYQTIENDDNIITQNIKYTPSIFIYKDGELLDYLDPKSNDDYDTYKTSENLSLWINQYIEVNIAKTENENNNEDCEDACIIKES